jgi:hypothetical protein
MNISEQKVILLFVCDVCVVSYLGEVQRQTHGGKGSLYKLRGL